MLLPEVRVVPSRNVKTTAPLGNADVAHCAHLPGLSAATIVMVPFALGVALKIGEGSLAPPLGQAAAPVRYAPVSTGCVAANLSPELSPTVTWNPFAPLPAGA